MKLEVGKDMNNKKSFIRGALCGALVMLFVGVIGIGAWKMVSVRLPGDTLSVKTRSEMETKLENINQLIEEKYLYSDEIDEETLVDGIYAGYTNALGDPYSVYYDEQQTKLLLETTTGEFSGVGALMTQDADTKIITIVNVYKDSPAEKAGLKKGDILYKVDDRELANEDLGEVVSWIKGESGTEVTLHVYRGAELEDVECTAIRGIVQAQTVEYSMKEDQIGYILVTEFDGVTLEQFQTAMDDLEKQGMKGLVVDLRGNPGGNLDAVVEMLKTILPKGVVVSTKDKMGNTEELTNGEDHSFNKPLTILVDQGSASAAEIFAGAVQDYKIGTIVGKTTYGKGIVQQLFDLQDGTTVKITVSEYFTPNGRNIHKKGIVPDVEVQYEPNEENPQLDNQLDKALEITKEKIK